ncbi:UNKNOWN [Stylonychia lemnae]|uniref:Major facilitator superfamily protein n=1 Tax=Stylonychia lemnae TaxID=5949 RepID=A0A078A4U0_STYLE|nr:UNKNOWN [Stylonychia lemnae]|eukprot:CDW77197.1 UNKNOWN [Stylonychia lemnae]
MLTFFIIMAAITGLGSFLLFLLSEPLSENKCQYQDQLLLLKVQNKDITADEISLENAQNQQDSKNTNNTSLINSQGIKLNLEDIDQQLLDSQISNNQMNMNSPSLPLQKPQIKDEIQSQNQEQNQNDNHQKAQTTIIQSLTQTLRLFKTRKMLILCAYMIQARFTNSFSTGIFFPMLNNTLNKTMSSKQSYEYSMFVLSNFGLGEIFGAISISFVIKYYKSNKFGVLYHLILSTAGYGFLIAYSVIYEYNALAYLFAFIFGMMDGASCTHIGIICGFEFGQLSATAMGVNFMVKPIFGFIVFLVEGQINANSSIELTIFYSVTYVICLILLLIMLIFFPFKPYN